MKKIYLQPYTEVVSIDTQEILNSTSPNLQLNMNGSVNAANVDARERGTRQQADDFDDLW